MKNQNNEIWLSKDSHDYGLILLNLKRLNVKIAQELEGPDQSYIDFIYLNQEYTLHREHYLGVSLYSEGELNQILVQSLKVET